MPIDVEKRRWRSGDVAEAAGISIRLFRSWRDNFALFPWATAGKKGNRFSIVDTAVVIAANMLREAGFGDLRSAIGFVQTNLPVHFRAIAHNRLNFGVWSGVTAPVWQRGSACAVTTVLDLDAVIERVIAGLDLPTPAFPQPPRPRLETAPRVVARAEKYVNSPSFERRCAAFVKAVAKREPPATTLEEISRALGVPLWMLTMQDETHQAWPIAERVRGEVRGVLQ
jgi:hypothetical protein